ncbi:MAG: Hint domain-containing protein, partial [Paracoccaceae bacterium]
TVDMGGGPVTITGVTFYVSGGPAAFTPTDGTILSNATFVSSTFVTVSTQIPIADLAPPCFVRGTMILTPKGEVAVENLRPGDLVVTLDHGAQRVRWIGMSEVDASGEFAPVLIRAGALGNSRALRVSPQHRILVQGWQAELYFGQSAVLVAAKHLVDGAGIVQETGKSVCYFHMMFSQHELVTSDGVLSESFFPGDQVMLRDRATRDELFELFPELADITSSRFAQTARATIRHREARVLVSAG